MRIRIESRKKTAINRIVPKGRGLCVVFNVQITQKCY